MNLKRALMFLFLNNTVALFLFSKLFPTTATAGFACRFGRLHATLETRFSTLLFTLLNLLLSACLWLLSRFPELLLFFPCVDVFLALLLPHSDTL